MSTSPPLVVADRYRLVAPLGQGGMGRVWRATDVVLHRDVAIKELVPPPGLTPDERQEMRERSLREARAIARLNNVNVVRVFDVLRTDADPWIVMEYVPSRSLQDILAADGPMTPVRAAEVGLGVLNALRAAHRNGVVHRDIKPGNVLIGEDGRVVLTDFGLATVPGDPNVTRTGLVLGSPAYIAPERARDGTAGPGADLWSLGATLYAAVEGASPFARPSAIATLAALATENPPPSRNAGPLKPVLNGLLRKDPAHRINADEAERLLLRAVGRRSKLSFPMSPTMRRPGAGRERPALPGPTPVVPGSSRPVVSGSSRPVVSGGSSVSGSAPVVPGPRPPVSTGRPPAATGNPPPGRPAAQPDDGRRPTVFVPGKATVGRSPQPAPDAPKLDATRIDTPPVKDFPRTGRTSPPAPTRPGPEAAAASSPTGAHGALVRGSRGAFGTISAAEVAAHRTRGTTPEPAPTASASVPIVDRRPPATDEPAPPAERPPTAAETRVDLTTDSPAPATDRTVVSRGTVTPPRGTVALPGGAVASPGTTARGTVSAGDEPVAGIDEAAGEATQPGGPIADVPPPEAALSVAASDVPAVSEAPAVSGALSVSDAPAVSAALSVSDAPAVSEAPSVSDAPAASGARSDAAPLADAVDASVTGTTVEPLPEAAEESPRTADPEGAAATASTSKADATAATGKPETERAADEAGTADSPSDPSGAGTTAPGDEPAAATSTGGAAVGSTPIQGTSTGTPGTPTPSGGTSPGASPSASTSSTSAGDSETSAVTAASDVTATSGISRKPSVGARAGAGKSSRKKGRGRNTPKETAAPSTSAVTAAGPQQPAAASEADAAADVRGVGPTATPAADTTKDQPTAGTAADSTTADSTTADSTAKVSTTADSTAKDGTPVASDSVAAEKPAADSGDPARPSTAAAPGSTTATGTPDPAGATAAEATQTAVTRTGSPAPGQRPAPASKQPARDKTSTTASARATKSAPKSSATTGAPATTESLASTSILGVPAARASDSPSGTAAPRRTADGTRVLSTGPTNAQADSGVPGFPSSRRPAWQPMAMPPRPASKRGVTVLGTTLTRRQTAIGVLILAAVLLALIVLVPRAFGADRPTGGDRGAGVTMPPVTGSGTATPGASAPVVPPPAPATTTAAPPSSAPASSAAPSSPAASSSPAATTPEGFSLYEDPSGFTVPLPNGWRAERRGSEVYFQSGGGDGRLLIIDQTDQPKGDPVADWEAQEADRQGSTYRNYQRVRIDAVQGYFTKAADWEFRYTTSRGNAQHAQKRGFVTSPNRAYGISFYTSPDDWDANRSVLETIYQGFKPARS